MDADKMNKLEARDMGGMPGPGSGKIGKVKLTEYAVKYLKADIDDAASMLQVSSIETKALHAEPGREEVVLIDKSSFTFMDRYFIIIKFLEKI
jgi:hypothetical protein